MSVRFRRAKGTLIVPFPPSLPVKEKTSEWGEDTISSYAVDFVSQRYRLNSELYDTGRWAAIASQVSFGRYMYGRPGSGTIPCGLAGCPSILKRPVISVDLEFRKAEAPLETFREISTRLKASPFVLIGSVMQRELSYPPRTRLPSICGSTEPIWRPNERDGIWSSL